MSSKRAVLLQKVSETGFAVDDIVLYLDTHPSCQKGLQYYRDVVEQYESARKCYEEEFGPLRKTENNCEDYFTWVDNPWPWEGGCE